jgi:hypothetical protein
MAEFRANMEVEKARGVEVRMLGHTACLTDPKHVLRSPDPFVFRCQHCQERAGEIVQEVFGELPPAVLSERCADGERGEKQEKFEELRERMRTIKRLGGRCAVFGHVLEMLVGDNVYDAIQFNCAGCLKHSKAVIEEVFGVPN